MNTKSEKQISAIPNEILEKILLGSLAHRDGLTCLLKLRQVCKRWKNIIEERILKSKTNEQQWCRTARISLQRNSVLEFLNIGPSRFRGTDRKCSIRAIESRRAPVFDTLNRIRKVEIDYSDGCFIKDKPQWNRLILQQILISSGSPNAIESTLHQKAKYVHINSDIYGLITSIKLSGQMMITGHSSGTICFWDLRGNLLHNTKIKDIKYIVSINLIDAYKKGPYRTNYISGQQLTIDHHAIAVLSNYGCIYLWTLNVSSNAYSTTEESLSESCWNLKCLIRMDSIHDIRWKVNYVRVFGDVILAVYDEKRPFALFNYEENNKKVMLLRLDTKEELSSRPNKLPEIQTTSYLHFKTGYHRLLPGDCCNLWYLPGSYAWHWQCINIIHHTGRLYRCFLPNDRDKKSSHNPVWKRFAPIEQNDIEILSNLTLRLEDRKVFKDRIHASIYLIVPKFCKQKSEDEVKRDPSTNNEILIDGKKYVILEETETYKAFQIEDNKTAYLYDKIEACHIFRDDVFIMRTKAKEMLISVEGLFYRYYTELDFRCFGNANISACYFTMNLFIIGTSNGLLNAYSVQKSSDLLILDFEKPSWTEKGKYEGEIEYVDVGLINSAGKVAIVTMQENNLVTVIERSFDFLH